MTPINFAYWLQGFVELSEASDPRPTPKQWAMICEHLKLATTTAVLGSGRENEFCVWLTGFVELTKGRRPTHEQWAAISEKLAAVFVKVTRSRPSLLSMPIEPAPKIGPYRPGLGLGAPLLPDQPLIAC